VVPIPWPFVTADVPLTVGAEFKDGSLQFHVDKAGKVAERPSWQVSVRDVFGPKRMLQLDQTSPLVLSLTEKITMGRGDEYQLKLESAGSETLSGDQLTALAGVVQRLTALRGKLNLPNQTQEVDWKPEQLTLLREQLPALAELALTTPLSSLVESAHRDLKLQSGRATAVADLGGRFVGSAVEPFAAKGTEGEWQFDALAGHVTVLHFWDYRDEPLKEPYGQVGYLDFLYHRRKPAGLQVYGVAVDGRFGDEKTRGAAERSVKKLREFMNLSYPVLFDAGALVKQFGDPRPLGAALPLFVVVGPDQKILHYHVGMYEVRQDQGLKELDQVVGEALDRLKATAK